MPSLGFEKHGEICEPCGRMGSAKDSRQPSPLSFVNAHVTRRYLTRAAAVTQAPRRYPTRVRISAVQNPPSASGRDGLRNSGYGKTQRIVSATKKKRKRQESQDNGKIDHQSENSYLNNGSVLSDVILAENNLSDVVTRRKVKVALSMFQTIYRKLLQKEEAKLMQRMQGVRTVLEAYRLFKEKNTILEHRKYVGSVPGIEIGDEFQFRVELCLTNLHSLVQQCVGTTDVGGEKVAVSVVSYGSFNHYLKNSNVLVFPGLGDRDKHQKLEHANLALKNSINTKTPVRVIRGIKGWKNKHRGYYVYDGLFTVEKFWRKRGSNNFFVFMFQLRRVPGQPELAIKRALSSGSRIVYGLCTKDISLGEENVVIPVVNTMDNDVLMPFTYITKLIYPSNYKLIPSGGCNCINGCSDSIKCSCAVRNGGELPFNYSGSLVEAKPLVYECGPFCKCPPSCHNRVSQHGMKFPLEIFKTETMGWGVRSLTSIPSGSFICEYVGELLEDEEAQKRKSDEYLFAIGNNYYDEVLWEGLSTFIPDLQKKDNCEVIEDGGFTIDASRYGNVGRFINHSCTPNLYAQNLMYDHNDKRVPHVMFFATENIPPFEELTYHYNYVIDDVHDANGNIRKKECFCGTSECTGRLY